MRKRSFHYCLDPVCVAAALIYACNRWCIKPSLLGEVGFFHDYLNDVLCIPLFLPMVLLVHRIIGLRLHDANPSAPELLSHLIIWSICFEAVAPLFADIYRTTADLRDVAAYAIGTALADGYGAPGYPNHGQRAAVPPLSHWAAQLGPADAPTLAEPPIGEPG